MESRRESALRIPRKAATATEEHGVAVPIVVIEANRPIGSALVGLADGARRDHNGGDALRWKEP